MPHKTETASAEWSEVTDKFDKAMTELRGYNHSRNYGI
jgi:hypothetical protein